MWATRLCVATGAETFGAGCFGGASLAASGLGGGYYIAKSGWHELEEVYNNWPVGVPMSGETNFSRWLVAGIPSAVVFAGLSIIVLHVGAKIAWNLTILPATVLVLLFTTLYIVMYWVRKQYRQSRDLRLGIFVFGAFGLVAWLAGMRYAELFGVIGSATINANYAPFSLYIVGVTLIAMIIFTFWKPK